MEKEKIIESIFKKYGIVGLILVYLFYWDYRDKTEKIELQREMIVAIQETTRKLENLTHEASNLAGGEIENRKLIYQNREEILKNRKEIVTIQEMVKGR